MKRDCGRVVSYRDYELYYYRIQYVRKQYSAINFLLKSCNDLSMLIPEIKKKDVT